MFRRILAWALIVLATLLLIVSIAGIAAIWIYRVPLTNRAVAQLQQVDEQLTQAKAALDNGKSELERTLRIVNAAQDSLALVSKQMSDAKALTDQVNSLLTDRLMPGLQSTRGQIDQLRSTLQQLRDSLKALNSVPFLNLNLPGDQLLADIVNGVDSLDHDIASAESLTQQASTFVGDSSYLLGGNLSETKQHIQSLLDTVNEYDGKVTGWQTEVRSLIVSLPSWINDAAIGLTIFLLWFGLSQFGLILHGLALREGKDPLAVLRRLSRPRGRGAYVD